MSLIRRSVNEVQKSKGRSRTISSLESFGDVEGRSMQLPAGRDPALANPRNSNNAHYSFSHGDGDRSWLL